MLLLQLLLLLKLLLLLQLLLLLLQLLMWLHLWRLVLNKLLLLYLLLLLLLNLLLLLQLLRLQVLLHLLQLLWLGLELWLRDLLRSESRYLLKVLVSLHHVRKIGQACWRPHGLGKRGRRPSSSGHSKGGTRGLACGRRRREDLHLRRGDIALHQLQGLRKSRSRRHLRLLKRHLHGLRAHRPLFGAGRHARKVLH